MPIINRDLATSQKKIEIAKNFDAVVATGVTSLIQVLEYNSMLTGVNVCALGISGSPVWSLWALRFNATGGQTVMGLGCTLSPQAFGTSGCVGFSIAPPGISMLMGDVLFMTTAGSNAAVATASVKVVTYGLSDIRVFQNSV